MKIKVSFEQIIDSEEFYYDEDPEYVKDLTFEQFKDGIYNYLDKDRYLIENFNFELVEE